MPSKSQALCAGLPAMRMCSEMVQFPACPCSGAFEKRSDRRAIGVPICNIVGCDYVVRVRIGWIEEFDQVLEMEREAFDFKIRLKLIARLYCTSHNEHLSFIKKVLPGEREKVYRWGHTLRLRFWSHARLNSTIVRNHQVSESNQRLRAG
jgi:hypothetical protein